jgi:hypothetical protein
MSLMAATRCNSSEPRCETVPIPGADGHFVGVRLCVGDELGHRLHAERGAHHQRLRRPPDRADRHEVALGHVGDFPGPWNDGERRDAAEQHGVAVKLSREKGLGAVQPAAAAAILDDDRLAEPAAHILLHEPCAGVARTAGRVGHNDLDRT